MVDATFQNTWFSKPGDTIFALMRTRGLSVAETAHQLGLAPKFFSSLLAGTIGIDDQIASRLSESVGGSLSFWKARQARFDQDLDRAAKAVPDVGRKSWLNLLPIKEMINAGWIERSRDPIELMKTSLKYFDVNDPDEWHERYAAPTEQFSFRTSPTYASKVGALSAWLRQGEIQAQSVTCAGWNGDQLLSRLSDLRSLTKIKNPILFVPKLRDLCAAAGVAVVFVRAPAGCRASGATRFLSPEKAMIILSFRYLSDDHFWFTFFHEVGHLVLHGSNSTFLEVDDLEKSEKEIEANSFSAGVLVPPQLTEKLLAIRTKADEVMRFAISTGVSPGIIVGQLQHLGVLGPNQLNYLKRRYDWNEIPESTN